MSPLNQTMLETLFDRMIDAVYLIDPDSSNIIWCNRMGYEELGLEKHEVVDHSVLSLQKDIIGMPQWQEVAQVIKQSDYYTFVGRHAKKDGTEISVEVNTTHFVHEQKEYFLSIARNVSKRLALEKDLQEKNHRIWYALYEASDGMWEWDMTNDSVFFSPQLKKMLGYGPNEMEPVVETWSENVHPEDIERVFQIRMDHINGSRESYDAEYRLRNRNGHYLWVHDRGKICERDQNGNPTHMVGMVQNITDRKKLQCQLEELAANDVLTELPNRRKGEELAKQQLALSQRTENPLSIVVVDLDHFKSVNDMFGHQKGDEVLQFSAQLLKSSIRESDIVYRWGGEEFIIVLPATNIEQAQKVTDQIHRVFANANWEHLEIPPLTLSVGIAVYPHHGKSFDSLLKEADAAVYAAKEKGRNQTYITQIPE